MWRNSTVGIAGAGGLGSNIAINLCRAGVGKLIIADFDHIVPNNLNRQQYYHDQIGMLKVEALRSNLLRIGGLSQIQINSSKVSPDNLAQIFSEASIMLEAFDRNEEKAMLLENWSELYPDRYYIGASGLAGVGGNETITTRRFGNVFIIGDGSSELTPGISPVAARVALVAAMQANLALELLLLNDLSYCSGFFPININTRNHR